MLLGAHAHQLAICGDYIRLPHARCVEAVLAPEPPEAAAHRVADDADLGGGTLQAGKAVHLGLVDQVGPERAGLDPRGPGHGSTLTPLMPEVLIRTPRHRPRPRRGPSPSPR